MCREEAALAAQERLMLEYKQGLEQDRAARMGLGPDGGVKKVSGGRRRATQLCGCRERQQR
jgi:hypothetical protein